jgi:hypothetical protein
MKYIVILILFSNNAFGQNSSFWELFISSQQEKLKLNNFEDFEFVKRYRIWTNSQLLEFIKINDSTYEGSLINYINKVYRKSIPIKTIYQKQLIPILTVEKIMNQIYNESIETLNDCDDIEGCVTGLDGKTYIFEIGFDNNRKIYTYWEPEDDDYQNSEIVEIKNVRNILNVIRTEIKNEYSLKKFIDDLPIGTYSNGETTIQKF